MVQVALGWVKPVFLRPRGAADAGITSSSACVPAVRRCAERWPADVGKTSRGTAGEPGGLSNRSGLSLTAGVASPTVGASEPSAEHLRDMHTAR